jgi:prolyl 4-hydroxylase
MVKKTFSIIRVYKRPILRILTLGFIIIIIWILGKITYNWWYSKEIYEAMATSYSGRGYSDETAPYVTPKLHSNFITDDEREYILNQAKDKFEDSIILGGTDKGIRKSKTAWLPRDDPVIKPIIERVCDLTGVPHEHAEKLQVVRYEPDGYYKEHHDAACDPGKESYEFEKNGGQRKVTMLLYLSDGFEGGSTRFPNLDLEMKPDKNGGILFFPLQQDGDKCHPNALHAGMPVTNGEKYIANVWLRENPYSV